MILFLLLGAEGSCSGATQHPAVYTVSDGFVDADGVYHADMDCYGDLAYPEYDLTPCCAPGFWPVGVVSGGIVCMESSR